MHLNIRLIYSDSVQVDITINTQNLDERYHSQAIHPANIDILQDAPLQSSTKIYS